MFALILGSMAAPIVNTAIIGAFSKISGVVAIDTVKSAIRETVPVKNRVASAHLRGICYECGNRVYEDRCRQ